MSIGVATANSILLVTFANEQRQEGHDAISAALSAGFTRLRPVLMTALAMIIGMLPMALGLGEGGEQNAPLGRAVIGGLSMATLATLFFVPVVYSRTTSQAIARVRHSRGCFAGAARRPNDDLPTIPRSNAYAYHRHCNPNPCLLQKCRLMGSGRPAEAASA